MASVPKGPRSPLGLKEVSRFRNSPLDFVADCAARYGDMVSFRLGRRQAYLVNHPDLVREVLVTTANAHRRGPIMQRARLMMGDGLLTSEEPLHTEQRRALQPAFHRERVAGYACIADEVMRTVAGSWQDGASIDVRGEMLRASLDVVGQSLFGSDLRGETQRIAEAVNASMVMMDLIFVPWSKQLLRFPFGRAARFREALRYLDDVIDRLIAAGEAGGDGIAGWLLQRRQDAAWRRQVRDECLTLLLAGHETVANALTFALLLVAQRADIAERIGAEADLHAHLPPGERVDRLRYARAVLAEAMRLYPPVWILGRTTRNDVSIGSQNVGANSVIFLSQWVVHRDARWFPEPLAFVPERFLDGSVQRQAYFPFGAGSRQCIGESFAWMEGTLALAAIARRWRLELISDPQPPLTARVTLRPTTPVTIRVTTRSTARR
jgi:cytochrome P450